MIVIKRVYRMGFEMFEVTEAGILVSMHFSEAGARTAAKRSMDEIYI